MNNMQFLNDSIKVTLLKKSCTDTEKEYSLEINKFQGIGLKTYEQYCARICRFLERVAF